MAKKSKEPAQSTQATPDVTVCFAEHSLLSIYEVLDEEVAGGKRYHAMLTLFQDNTIIELGLEGWHLVPEDMAMTLAVDLYMFPPVDAIVPVYDSDFKQVDELDLNILFDEEDEEEDEDGDSDE